jgi:biopolymer transport protein ExbB
MLVSDLSDRSFGVRCGGAGALAGGASRTKGALPTAMAVWGSLTIVAALCFAPPLAAQPPEGAEPAAAQPPMADAPAAPAAAPPAAPPPAAEPAEDDTSGLPQNYLEWTFRALGLPYTLIFLIISMSLFALIVMNILAVRQENICPVGLIEGVEQTLAENNLAAAVELVRSDESVLGQVVTAGLGRLDRGFDHAIEAMQEVGEDQTMKLEHRLSYVALIGNISPMIGLLGTVQGMIAAFTVIATSTSTPKPSKLAEGISTALFTTLVGLMIAIPAIAIYNVLRNRMQRMVLETGTASESLLERFEQAGRN